MEINLGLLISCLRGAFKSICGFAYTFTDELRNSWFMLKLTTTHIENYPAVATVSVERHVSRLYNLT